MGQDFKLDTREFADAMREVLAEHKKDAPIYLNKKALSVIIGSKDHPGAVKLTPEAEKSAIEAVPRRKIAGFVIKRAKLAGDWPLTSPEINNRITKEIKRRESAIAYTRGPGWLKAAKRLGGSGVKDGKKGQPHPEFEKSLAAKGYAKPATPSRLISEIVNTAPAAELIGFEPLQKAIDGQAKDMREYGAHDLLNKTFKKHSAR